MSLLTKFYGILCLLCIATLCDAHGHVTLPASTRHGGALELGNNCENQACFWFSNNVEIPGPITLPNEMRSLQLNVTGQPEDVYATSPWRAPGSAPVFGSGCGVAGGDKDVYLNGGSIKGYPQGMDGVKLPKHGKPAVWKRGDTALVAQAITANHGGGYSYRLCPADGEISEECFQKTPLDFAGNESFVLYPNGTRIPFPLVSTRVGTTPKGSQWARDPVPGCYMCDAYKTCGAPLKPVPGTGGKGKDTCAPEKTEAECIATTGSSGQRCTWWKGGKCYDAARKRNDPAHVWDAQVNCYAACDGTLVSKARGACPEGTAQFPEGVPGISGFGKGGWEWSIADMVKVPQHLKPGPYLLSWRWDCEESTQVWQNCADIILE